MTDSLRSLHRWWCRGWKAAGVPVDSPFWVELVFRLGDAGWYLGRERGDDSNVRPPCEGGQAEPINADASRCPRCAYTFTTVPGDPTAVPPHWSGEP